MRLVVVDSDQNVSGLIMVEMFLTSLKMLLKKNYDCRLNPRCPIDFPINKSNETQIQLLDILGYPRISQVALQNFSWICICMLNQSRLP